MKSIRSVIRLALFAASLASPAAFGQTSVQIQEFSLPPGQIRLVVGHPRAGSTNFTLEASSLTNVWTAVAGGTVRTLALGQIEFTAQRPTNAYRFFRVLSLVGTNDTDADGLPDSVETALGTNPHLADTDGDGFSDGHELVAGTDPLDPNSFPTQSNLPVAAFTNSTSTATEGGGNHIVRVTFDRPFFGTLGYRVNPRSTAVAGVDYIALPGSVAVMGTTADIVIKPRDDFRILPERTLMLDLITNSRPYRVGIRSTHVVRLVDDDAYWSGTLKDAYAERNFRLSIARSNSVSSVCFVAGAGFDGLPRLTNEAPASATSLSEGIIPAGCTNAVVVTNTVALFHIVSPSLPAQAGTVFSGSNTLARTFTLRAATNQPTHAITERLMAGSYTERIGVAGSIRSHLDRTNTGTFALAREIPVAPAITNAVAAP